MGKRIVLYYPKLPESRHLTGDRYFPPLSLLCASAKLVQDGVEVEIVDGRLNQKPALDSEYLGVSVMTGGQILDALHVLDGYEGVKIWGGWHPTVLPIETAMDWRVDIAVKGQGEFTLSEIVSTNKMWSLIKGVSYKGDGRGVSTPDREFIPIDRLPRPKWDLVDWENYVIKRDDLRMSWYYSSQGCPHKCGYCCIGNCQPVLSKLPVKTVAADMLMFRDAYNVELMYFADNTFLVNTSWGAEIAEVMGSLGLKWMFQTRVPLINAMSDEQLLRLKKRGAYHIDLGVESGCDETLRRMNKGITVKEARTAIDKLVRLGFSVGANFIISSPGETSEQAWETFRFIDSLPETVQLAVNCYTPYPSTPLYDAAVQEGFRPPETLEEWGHHTINNRLPHSQDIREKYLSYRPKKPVLSVQRLKRAARHLERLMLPSVIEGNGKQGFKEAKS